MDDQLLRKWLERALLNYFHDAASIPYNEEEFALLQENIKKELHAEGAEDLYLVVQDVVYSYITSP